MIVFNCKSFSRAFIFASVLSAIALAHTSVEEAKAAKHSSIKKHHKRLKKQDGAIRLVGSTSDHEGKHIMENRN